MTLGTWIIWMAICAIFLIWEWGKVPTLLRWVRVEWDNLKHWLKGRE